MQSPFVATMPADYYRRHAKRVRQLAADVTTSAIKDHLDEVALEYEQLAETADLATRSEAD